MLKSGCVINKEVGLVLHTPVKKTTTLRLLLVRKPCVYRTCSVLGDSSSVSLCVGFVYMYHEEALHLALLECVCLGFAGNYK